MFDDLSLADRHPILVFLREALAAAPEHGPEIAAAAVRLAPSLAEAVTQTAVGLLPDMADRLRAATSADANSSEGETPAFLATLTARLGERRVGELLSAVEAWQRQDNNRKAEGEPAVSFLTAMLAMVLLASDTLADESNGAGDATSTPSGLPGQPEVQTAALTLGEAALNGSGNAEGTAQGEGAAPNDPSEAPQGGEQTAQAGEPGGQDDEVPTVQPAVETGATKDQVAQSSEQATQAEDQVAQSDEQTAQAEEQSAAVRALSSPMASLVT